MQQVGSEIPNRVLYDTGMNVNFDVWRKICNVYVGIKELG